MSWQPINTAPTDETIVFLTWHESFTRPKLVRRLFWDGGGSISGRWFCHEVDGCDYENEDPLIDEDGHSLPTHWHPLPEPPR